VAVKQTHKTKARAARQRPEDRAWQRMLSGRRLDLLDPSPLDIEIDDIAQGLSRVARWNGQTAGDWAFTVAQHSVLVEDLAGRLMPGCGKDWRLAALLHDAPEYVIGDLITPFKAAVGADYKALEKRLMAAIHLRFGLPGEAPVALARLIKRADRIAAYLEATQLAGFTPAEGRKYFGRPQGLDERALARLKLAAWPPATAKVRMLERFRKLTDKKG